MHARLSIFLEEHNIIYTSQFSFQKNKSTLHSLIEITENIRSCIENKNYGSGVFNNLKKAFNTVNHSILLKKLEHYGVCGAMLSWFSSYLNDRYQQVSLNNCFSDKKHITTGVPQRFVLRPLLFLIYINDLPNISKTLKIFSLLMTLTYSLNLLTLNLLNQL